jgi:hypothetical protein
MATIVSPKANESNCGTEPLETRIPNNGNLSTFIPRSWNGNFGFEEGDTMRREVTVGLMDLKILVGMCIDHEVDGRAQVMVLAEPGNSNATAAFEFAQLVEAARPEAKTRVKPRFSRLLDALESGKDVDASLASFVHGVNPASLIRPD